LEPSGTVGVSGGHLGVWAASRAAAAEAAFFTGSGPLE